MPNKILVIAPHADDEILGVGGTIAKYIKKNFIVKILIVTNAHNGAPELFSNTYMQKIRLEALRAHKSLGVDETFFLEYPAPSLSTYPSYKISLDIEKILLKFKPNILFLPNPGDIHQDHEAVYRASLVASRPSKYHLINKILIYEVLSETNYSPYVNNSFFVPNYFEDISKTIKLKIKSMKYYKSQLYSYPHSRSLEAIENLSKYRGNSINIKYAEAFMVERFVIK